MSKVMTAEGARDVAKAMDGLCRGGGALNTPRGRIDLREVVKSLNEYADMKERQTVDREGVIDALKAFRGIVRNDADQDADPARFADRILALISAGRVSVKALAWGKVRNHGPIKTSGDKGGSEVTAKGLFNTLYGVASTDGDKSFMAFKNMTVLEGRYESIEAAKAAAQAHYEAAILSAVEPGPDAAQAAAKEIRSCGT